MVEPSLWLWNLCEPSDSLRFKLYHAPRHGQRLAGGGGRQNTHTDLHLHLDTAQANFPRLGHGDGDGDVMVEVEMRVIILKYLWSGLAGTDSYKSWFVKQISQVCSAYLCISSVIDIILESSYVMMYTSIFMLLDCHDTFTLLQQQAACPGRLRAETTETCPIWNSPFRMLKGKVHLNNERSPHRAAISSGQQMMEQQSRWSIQTGLFIDGRGRWEWTNDKKIKKQAP